MLKIGIVREGKTPIDERVPLTPDHAVSLIDNYPDVSVMVQNSEIRCFQDEDYRAAGIPVMADISDADLMLGVKEVPINELIEGKSYMFFSHTIKKQAYNRELLRAILQKNITLIDYELLTNNEGKRIVAFGRYAGIVGAYNGILTYGSRYNLFKLRRAHNCFDLEDLKSEYRQVKLPPIKIVITGGGRVAGGAREVMAGMGIQEVSSQEFLSRTYQRPVYTQLHSIDYNIHKDGQPFTNERFHAFPHEFTGDFLKYAHQADLLIAGAYWDPASPVLFKRTDILDKNFKIRVIADITCDIEGSIPCTLQPCTIDDPIYDYDPVTGVIDQPFTNENNITVMAVDNLPCELPRDASADFGQELVAHVLPHLIGDDREGIIKRATITKNGSLTDRFAYLQDFVDGL
jgi:alanine dehydrogenase